MFFPLAIPLTVIGVASMGTRINDMPADPLFADVLDNR